MPSLEHWKLYQAIETAQKTLKSCDVDAVDNDYEASKRLRRQLRKVQRVLGQMWIESETVMTHISEGEVRKKKQIAKTDSDHAQ